MGARERGLMRVSAHPSNQAAGRRNMWFPRVRSAIDCIQIGQIHIRCLTSGGQELNPCPATCPAVLDVCVQGT